MSQQSRVESAVTSRVLLTSGDADRSVLHRMAGGPGEREGINATGPVPV